LRTTPLAQINTRAHEILTYTERQNALASGHDWFKWTLEQITVHNRRHLTAGKKGFLVPSRKRSVRLTTQPHILQFRSGARKEANRGQEQNRWGGGGTRGSAVITNYYDDPRSERVFRDSVQRVWNYRKAVLFVRHALDTMWLTIWQINGSLLFIHYSTLTSTSMQHWYQHACFLWEFVVCVSCNFVVVSHFCWRKTFRK